MPGPADLSGIEPAGTPIMRVYNTVEADAGFPAGST